MSESRKRFSLTNFMQGFTLGALVMTAIGFWAMDRGDKVCADLVMYERAIVIQESKNNLVGATCFDNCRKNGIPFEKCAIDCAGIEASISLQNR